MIDESLVLHLPEPPIAFWIRWRDRALTIRNRVRRIGNVLAETAFTFYGFKGERAVFVEIEIGWLCALRWPTVISVPAVGTGLKCLRLALERLAFTVQPVAKPGRFDILAILEGR